MVAVVSYGGLCCGSKQKGRRDEMGESCKKLEKNSLFDAPADQLRDGNSPQTTHASMGLFFHIETRVDQKKTLNQPKSRSSSPKPPFLSKFAYTTNHSTPH